MECLAGIAKDFAKDLVTGAVNQLRYACCFNKFVEELENEKGNLIAARNSVSDRIKQAEKQTKVPAEVMDKWLKDAKSDIDKMDELLEKAKTKKNCLPYCPNWFCRYYLGRKLANKKMDVERRTKEGHPYVTLERITTLPSGIMSEKCLKFESRQSAYEQLMKAVKDEDVSFIGLYGMGGCGKTTLAAEVGNRAEAENLFEKVLFVAVSSAVDVRRIQDKIASSLSYEFPPAENEESERAKRLHMRLTREKNILVILDDVWQKLNFGAIGIPSVEDRRGCKVLITTRSEDVCDLMDCQRKISLPILTDEDAWTLFQKQAHIFEGTSDTLKQLARKISNECKGLPVTIAAVASTLKGKAEVDWKVALDRLTSSIPLNIEKGLQDPYKCLQLSYDNLDSKEAKSLLLLCSVFPEDEQILVEDMTRYAIGLGIVGEVRTYERARNEVSTAKNKLVSSCLLLDVDDGKYVKMHDLVRDVAQWIAKNENKAVMYKLKNDVTTLEKHNSSSIRYLWSDDEFPNDLDSSNLEFLFMRTKLEVSDDVFKRMGKLRVLDLFNGKKRRPLSTMLLRSLTNLRYLFLTRWELSDFSFLEGMQKLEVLSMYNCSFRKLPDESVVTQLKKMKLFELYECSMQRNNFEVIGKLPHLEELYIIDDSSEWDVYNESSAEFFDKFSVPQTLQRYGIQFGTLFRGSVEEEVLSGNCKALILGCFHTSNRTFQGLAKKSNVLSVNNIQGGSKNIIPGTFQTDGGDMNHLLKLQISDSEQIEYLVDTSNHLSEVATLFSKLVELRIQKMKHLKALWHGQLPLNGDFHKLERLSLSDCLELTSLFTPSLLQLESIQSEYLPEISTSIQSTPSFVNHNSGSFNLSSLTSLEMKSCPKLGSLFSVSVAQTLISLEKLKIQDCQGLKHIVDAYRNQKEKIVEDDHEIQTGISMFSSLQTLCIGGCELLQYAFPISFFRCLVKLKVIEIKGAPNLKYIFGHSDVEDSPCHEHQKFDQLQLPVLETIELHHIPKMIGICQHNYYVICPSLQNLSLGIGKYVDFSTIDCSTIASEDRVGDYIAIKILNSEYDLPPVESAQWIEKQSQGFNILVMRNIREIELKGIEKVKYLFTLSNTSSMMLETLRIEACSGLKHIIDIGDDGGKKIWDNVFPNLKVLSVDNCDQLEYMFGQHHLDHQNYKELHIHFSSMEKLFLYNLPNFISICPAKSVSTTWPSLKKFRLDACSQFVNNSINDLMVSLDSSEPVSTTKKDIRGIHKDFLTLKTLHMRNSKLETIFCLNGHQISGQQVSLRLEKLKLEILPQMMYICVGSKNSFTFQNLHTLKIEACDELQVVFPVSVSRCLPELRSLEISKCKELKQIIEDDDLENKKLPNFILSPHPQPCFPKLGIIVIEQCHKLKRLFFASAFNDLPSLEVLIVNHASELEELIGCEQGKGYDIGEPKVELPKLKMLMFMHLSSLRQGTELQTVMHRVVHNCPKLSVTSTATPQEFKEEFWELGLELEHVDKWGLYFFFLKSLENVIVDPESQTISGSEFPSSQIEGKSEKEVTEKVPSSAVATTITSTGSKLIERPSSSSFEIPSLENHSHSIEAIVKENVQEEDQVMKVTLSTDVEGASLADSVAARREAKDKSFLAQDSQVVVPHAESTFSCSDSLESQPRSYPQTEKELIEKVSSSKAPVTTTLTDSELIERPSLSSLDNIPQHKTHSFKVENIERQSIEEGDQEGGIIGLVSNISTEVPQAGSTSSSESHSLIISKLGRSKKFDDRQIALLVEAISVYPHLWNVCEKFSERFQVWMLKTLADMLVFLRNESAVSVTSERQNEFHRLCDEAIQLGFERSWVDQMRQRVTVNNPQVDHARALLDELHKRHDQLAQELQKIKDAIDSVNHFVASQKKYFDFL